jgi:hypothetical protein
VNIHLTDAKNMRQSTGNDFAAGMTAVLNHIHCIKYMDYKLLLFPSGPSANAPDAPQP